MNKQTEVHSYNQIPLSQKTERATNTGNQMDESHRQNPARKARHRRVPTIRFHLQKALELAALIKGEKNQNGGCLWDREIQGTVWEGRNALYCDGDVGSTGVSVCQKCKAKICPFPCMLILPHRKRNVKNDHR